MKRILFNIGRCVAIFSFVYNIWEKVKKEVRNGYLSSRFYSMGENTCICEGVVLHDSKYIKIGG